MKRIKALNRYQKGILILLAAMLAIFCVVYSVVISKVGYLYKNTILLPSTQDGSTVYSGKLQEQEASFTVTADKEITFRLGDKVYGPYIIKKDASAKPKDHPMSTGIEIKKGDEIIFRGGVYQYNSPYYYFGLINEDGTSYRQHTTSINGITTDENGNVIDPDEPTAGILLYLYNGPELTHKGHWGFWFLALFVSILTTVSILFADELFRWYLRRRISDWQFAEPSEWEITSRYIGMTLMVALILFLYIKGLQ